MATTLVPGNQVAAEVWERMQGEILLKGTLYTREIAEYMLLLLHVASHNHRYRDPQMLQPNMVPLLRRPHKHDLSTTHKQLFQDMFRLPWPGCLADIQFVAEQESTVEDEARAFVQCVAAVETVAACAEVRFKRPVLVADNQGSAGCLGIKQIDA